MTGQEIVNEIMARRRIGPKDFYSRTRLPHVVSARRAAVKALKESGLRNADIAKLMRRHSSTISYWTHPGRRARRTVDALVYWHNRTAYA